MNQLREDLGRLASLLDKWHGGEGRATPLARKNGAACRVEDGETFCLCGLALVAAGYTPSPVYPFIPQARERAVVESRLRALFEALREVVGAHDLGAWSDTRGRRRGEVASAVADAIHSCTTGQSAVRE